MSGIVLGPAAAAAPLQVTATFSVLADMARQIGGAAVSVTSLVPPNADAHVFQPTPADLRTLAASSLLIENGLGLEGWMARLAGTAGFRGTRVVAAEAVTPRAMREGGDMIVDPHAWQNPRNGVLYAAAILRGLERADPGQAETFRAAAGAWRGRIDATDRWIEDQFAPIPPPARRIVATHDAFGYYGDRYGIRFLAAEGLSTDAEPSAKSIAALIAQIKREQVRAVFLENMTDPRLARMLARETGAALLGPLYSDALSEPDGPAPDYLTMLRYNTNLFVRAMRP